MISRLITASNLVRATSEDLPSQLNHVWTVTLLAAMGLTISLVQYVGDPIQCWCPAHMPEVHCNYTKALCWVKETYYVDFDEAVPYKSDQRKINEVTYYPWAPWILFFMAAMFKCPHLIWTGCAPISNLDLQSFIENADDDGDVVELATILRIWILQARMRQKFRFHGFKKILGAAGLFWLGRHRQSYLTGLAIFVKFLYLFISLCMFMSLRIFIDDDFLSYGWETAVDFVNGVSHDSARFPKHTICDLTVRQMNNVNTYSVLCILPINLYNQKIFLFLWYWYVVLTATNTYSLLHWAFNLLSPSRRFKLVNDYVIIMDHIRKQKELLGLSHYGSESSSIGSLYTTTGTGTTGTTMTPRRRNRSSVSKKSSKPAVFNSGDLINFDDDGVADDKNIANNVDTLSLDNTNDDASLLTVVDNAYGARLRAGKHVNYLPTDDNSSSNRKNQKSRKNKKNKQTFFQRLGRRKPSSIEVDQADEISDDNSNNNNNNIEDDKEKEKRKLMVQSMWMYRYLDYDGVLVFRLLELAVGVVVANDIFRQLYSQLTDASHHSHH